MNVKREKEGELRGLQKDLFDFLQEDLRLSRLGDDRFDTLQLVLGNFLGRQTGIDKDGNVARLLISPHELGHNIPFNPIHLEVRDNEVDVFLHDGIQRLGAVQGHTREIAVLFQGRFEDFGEVDIIFDNQNFLLQGEPPF